MGSRPWRLAWAADVFRAELEPDDQGTLSRLAVACGAPEWVVVFGALKRLLEPQRRAEDPPCG